MTTNLLTNITLFSKEKELMNPQIHKRNRNTLY